MYIIIQKKVGSGDKCSLYRLWAISRKCIRKGFISRGEDTLSCKVDTGAALTTTTYGALFSGKSAKDQVYVIDWFKENAKVVQTVA